MREQTLTADCGCRTVFQSYDSDALPYWLPKETQCCEKHEAEIKKQMAAQSK